MKLIYDKSYWDNYYQGSYEDTFHYGFNLEDILNRCWCKVFQSPPESFADIGCGPGQTLLSARDLLPKAKIYGVEYQQIPPSDQVFSDILFGDFLKISKTLEPVDLLYCACSMYIPWKSQEFFLKETVRLAKKAVCYANVYLTDGQAIPEDGHRRVIYSSKKDFEIGMRRLGLRRANSPYDFFTKI